MWDKKITKIINILFICFGIFIFSSLNLCEVYASEGVKKEGAEESNNVNEVDLLFKENTDLNIIVQEIKEIDSNIKVTSFPEIYLLRVQIPNTISNEVVTSNSIVKKALQNQGNLSDIEFGKIDLSDVYAGEPLPNEFKSNQRRRMTGESLFDLMAWHVDEVTGEGKSFELSTGEGVRIAVIDSGVDINHPILSGKINVNNAKSFVTDDRAINDLNGHGTMVSGIIAQIAPDAVMTPYKVIGVSSGDSLWTISAMLQAVNDGNDIINMSLGTYKCKDIESEKLTIKAFERAAKYAEKKRVIVVASSGNLALDLDEYYKTEHVRHLPGTVKGIIAVSAVNNKQIASYSNYGSHIQFCAPGGDLVYTDGYLDLSQWIYCLYPTAMDNGLEALGVPQGYTFSYGTSLAAPATTAALADILSYYELNEQAKYQGNKKNIKSKDIISTLSKSALDLGNKGKDPYYGYGEIDIYKALMKVFESKKGKK